ncbi:unnamed protein product, partial [Dovyalis caffra]
SRLHPLQMAKYLIDTHARVFGYRGNSEWAIDGHRNATMEGNIFYKGRYIIFTPFDEFSLIITKEQFTHDGN